MRTIALAELDKRRPVLILTRESARHVLTWVTVAPITSAIRGVATEVPVGPANGLDQESVVSCDNITTVRADAIGESIGLLLDRQEPALARALNDAFDLYQS